jgi:hypothetical protein
LRFRLQWDGPGTPGTKEVATAKAASDRYLELLAERRVGLRVYDEAGRTVTFEELLRRRRLETWA